MDFGVLPTTALSLLQIAVALPLVVRWFGGRPAGTVASVTGRLRWGWLGTCLLLALPCVAGLLLTAQIALYSVAVRRGTRVTVAWTAVAVVCGRARGTVDR